MKLKDRPKTGENTCKHDKGLIASIVRISKSLLKILISQKKSESRIIS